uniref:Uncharacterized protein n=1 Tax=Anguilla anguilla TaxID=7936 RepID=A0A0E9R2J1_ANGAN
MGLSGMMYASGQYLSQQSPDSFDIFINMSSIINHRETGSDPSSLHGIRLQLEDKVISRRVT